MEEKTSLQKKEFPKTSISSKTGLNMAFMPYFLVQANFPYAQLPEREFVRKNGNLTLSLYSPAGLPFGSIPRLVISFIVTEAIRKKTREIYLGESLSDFLNKLGLACTGGKNGTIQRLHKQLDSLFSCFISCSSLLNHDAGKVKFLTNMLIADKAMLWWEPQSLYDESGKFRSCVYLSERFYEAITAAPVPVDLDVLLHLKRSPMAIDIYCWATYKMYNCKARTFISWDDLSLQFGSIDSNLRKFKFNFLKHLKSVMKVYPDFKYDSSDPKGLVVFPSPTSVKSAC